MTAAQAGDVREFSLPDQRERLTVQFGGISRTHVVKCVTFTSGRDPGRWVRKAADHRALCGALPYCLVGIDVADWDAPGGTPLTEKEFARVDCARCRKSYQARLDRAATLTPPAVPTPDGP